MAGLRAIVIAQTGATTQKVIIDRDCVLVRCQATGGAWTVSLDPALAWSDLKTPGTARVIDMPLFAYLSGDGGSSFYTPQLDFPLAKGTAIWASNSSNSAVILWLADPPQSGASLS